MGIKQPLSCQIEGEELVIRIGIDTLAWAAEQSPAFLSNSEWPWYHVDNQSTFANAVRQQIMLENEMGESPLTNLLDDMFEKALEDGCEGVERVPD